MKKVNKKPTTRKIKTFSDIGCLKINGVYFHNSYGDGDNTLTICSDILTPRPNRKELAYFDTRQLSCGGQHKIEIHGYDCESGVVETITEPGGWYLYREAPLKFLLKKIF